MEKFNLNDWPYEEARFEGGIHAFDDVLKLDRTKAEIGDEPVPSKEGAERYAAYLEELERAQQGFFEDDENLLAA